MEQCINIELLENTDSLFGNFDSNIKTIEKAFDVSIIVRNSELKISGNPCNVDPACETINRLIILIKQGQTINDQTVEYVASMIREGDGEQISNVYNADCVCITASGKPIKPKTIGQQNYISSIENNTIVFGIGPAGTGKTYLAVAEAVKAFRAGSVNRIILTRPAVEAGEKLGFLPGDLQQKVDPYLRPLYDALFDMLGPESYAKFHERGNIEIAPLAYMRGRTLDDSFIILDEAQNTTREQMKMFLTRMGFNSRMVITGDITQIDLPDGKKSGLREAAKILKDVEDIEIVYFNEKDVVRHRLVQSIIKAYEKSEQNRQIKFQNKKANKND